MRVMYIVQCTKQCKASKGKGKGKEEKDSIDIPQ